MYLYEQKTSFVDAGVKHPKLVGVDILDEDTILALTMGLNKII